MKVCPLIESEPKCVLIRIHLLGCQTAYYNNYSVKDGMRRYYDGTIPDIIQVGEHQFVEKKVVNMWRTDMNISWYVLTIHEAL